MIAATRKSIQHHIEICGENIRGYESELSRLQNKVVRSGVLRSPLPIDKAERDQQLTEFTEHRKSQLKSLIENERRTIEEFKAMIGQA